MGGDGGRGDWLTDHDQEVCMSKGGGGFRGLTYHGHDLLDKGKGDDQLNVGVGVGVGVGVAAHRSWP